MRDRYVRLVENGPTILVSDLSIGQIAEVGAAVRAGALDTLPGADCTKEQMLLRLDIEVTRRSLGL